MRTLIAFLAGLGIIGYLMIFAWVFFAIAMMVYGLYLAFSASVILGIIVFLVEPSPLVIGLVMFFFQKNLAQMLIEFLNKQ